MRWRGALTIAVAAIASLPVLVSAQWPSHLRAGIPKTADGKPNLSAPDAGGRATALNLDMGTNQRATRVP